MIGDIDSSTINVSAAKQLLADFTELTGKHKKVIAIAGESGSGKTHMALALKSAFSALLQQALILHMDDFYVLPPALNHQNRLLGMHNVGPQEVDLPRMQQVLRQFKSGAKSVVAPVVHYYENKIEDVLYDFQAIEVLIIEGTYAFYVEQTDFHLFMTRDYTQTKSLRIQRNRGNEANDPFIEKVLEKEHQLVVAKKEKADAWIDYDFNLKYHAE